MFEKVLLFEKKQKRTKPMVLAVLFEITVITLLIFSPLFFKKDDIKKVVFLEQFFLPPLVPQGPGNVEKKPGPPPSKKKQETRPVENPPKDILESPAEIPKDIVKGEGDENKTVGEGETENVGGVPGGKPCDSPNCVVGGTGAAPEGGEPHPDESGRKPPPPPNPPRVGGNVKQAKLIHKVEPKYPEIARRNRVQGDVFLEAIIGTDGNTHNTKVISGHILLRQSSIDAVKQWKYEPATLNGEPIEVTTNITVKYILK